MSKFLKFLAYLFLFLAIFSLGLYILGYGYIFRAVQVTYLNGHKTAFIDDYIYFDNRIIKASETNQEWPVHSAKDKVQPTEELKRLNAELQTAAFLIIKNDSIWFEEYFNDFTENSRTNSFSMAKTITTAMLFKAIQEGYIENLDQPVADFFPEFDKRLTLGDLSSMASGLNWNESYYNPFASTARGYFGKDIKEQILELKVIEEPGKEFSYLSGNTELLGMVLEKATGKNLSEYLSESFWKPLGMNSEAYWQLDSEQGGMEKAYCCIASNARNFAKFGKLFNHYGEWEGKQLIDSAFIAKATQPRFEETPYYGYSFWLSDHLGKKIYYMRGVLGQYVICIPEDELIVIRLGEKVLPKKSGENHYEDFYLYLDEVYKMLNNNAS
ncbi:serine hydrolase [Gramella sp. AN32]|uniref:Serine hydrolase domain-containing protein n=1 Tax=Christiangramia antarctica TaxID=2058158 RepID=A0ABW5X062_9FLAO|nr:serine hydrolase [Gramella sp. AN32]MCM4155067.1 serine hydrolase [Gramella sp. AN32]